MQAGTATVPVPIEDERIYPVLAGQIEVDLPGRRLALVQLAQHWSPRLLVAGEPGHAAAHQDVLGPTRAEQPVVIGGTVVVGKRVASDGQPVRLAQKRRVDQALQVVRQARLSLRGFNHSAVS